jgi:transposase
MALFIEQRQEEEFTKKVANNTGSLLKLIKKLSKEFHLRVCYEASGCGFVIYRKLVKHNIDCIVVAPSLIPTDHKKVKTDKIDAIKLAKYFRSGLLTAINVPNEQQEQDRHLIRFRMFQVNKLARIKQSISAFIYRKGIHHPGSKHFTQSYRRFLCGQLFQIVVGPRF